MSPACAGGESGNSTRGRAGTARAHGAASNQVPPGVTVRAWRPPAQSPVGVSQATISTLQEALPHFSRAMSEAFSRVLPQP